MDGPQLRALMELMQKQHEENLKKLEQIIDALLARKGGRHGRG